VCQFPFFLLFTFCMPNLCNLRVWKLLKMFIQLSHCGWLQGQGLLKLTPQHIQHLQLSLTKKCVWFLHPTGPVHAAQVSASRCVISLTLQQIPGGWIQSSKHHFRNILTRELRQCIPKYFNCIALRGLHQQTALIFPRNMQQ